MVATHRELARKLAELEHRFEDYDEEIEAIFKAIRQLMASPEKKRNRIGFEVKEGGILYGKRTRRG